MAAEGERIGRALDPGAVVHLQGELGAGKTTMVRAIARGLGVAEAATSPTYALVHRYAGRRGPVFHLDCYRLQRPDESADVDWEGLAADGDALLIEWPERAIGWVPAGHHSCAVVAPGGSVGARPGARLMRLAIDTATSRLSVALGRTASGAVHEVVEGARQHAAALLPAIDRLLARAGVSRSAITSVVVADGPGSFTGLRVGAAVGKALVSASGVEFWVVPSLLTHAVTGSGPGPHHGWRVRRAARAVLCRCLALAAGRHRDDSSARGPDARAASRTRPSAARRRRGRAARRPRRHCSPTGHRTSTSRIMSMRA